MDCRFCNVRLATHLRVPTDFGLVELCDECAKQYGRRWRHNGELENTSTTGSPATAARCDELFPDPQRYSRSRKLRDDTTHSTESR